MISLLALTKSLIEKKSVTPDDAGCIDLISELLQKQNFQLERFDTDSVKNLFAYYGDHGPLLIFLGHTDVVPSGPIEQWQFPPFSPTEHEDYLYGRGAADMKSAVAAMVCALINFIQQNPKINFRVGLLLTSDEEGVALHGTRHVMEVFQQRGIKVDYCLVGEASSEKIFGDTIKVGRRGTLSGKLTIYGKQGHIAYPQLAKNPIHCFAKALNEICENQWDDNHNAYFQATQCQFSNIHAGTGANNVIPGTLIADFNFRFSTTSTPESLQQKFIAILDKHQLKYTIDWHLGGLPFLTEKGLLLDCTQQTVQSLTGITPALSTAGGTSDGRFVAPTGAEVIEFGVINQTIHQINECVKIDDLSKLSEIYLAILYKMNEKLA
ncbi:MAG: succinyl-diaminopimelate desuccinylase [Gammaproteobacteria bacterium]|jgi:succinyl-diaminopimelate desuccinylase|nr:succinyl-diaminopimelate desuccinylase [Gammaproteobacteria bacterium]